MDWFFSFLLGKCYCASVTYFLTRSRELFIWLLNFNVRSILLKYGKALVFYRNVYKQFSKLPVSAKICECTVITHVQPQIFKCTFT